MVKVKPAEGRKVRDPKSLEFIPADKPTEVNENDKFWAKRIACGDVVVEAGKESGKDAGAKEARKSN